REDSSCQPGAVHTWPKAPVPECLLSRRCRYARCSGAPCFERPHKALGELAVVLEDQNLCGRRSQGSLLFRVSMNYLFTSGGLQQVRCELEIRLFHIIPQLSFSPVSYVLIRLARNRIRYDDLPWSRF